MSSLPAGWYKDPADPVTQRYWDGEGWLGKAIPADAVPPDGPPPVEEPSEPPPAAPSPGAPSAGVPSPGVASPGAPSPGAPSPAGQVLSPPGWPQQPPAYLYKVQARPHGLALAGYGSRLLARLVDIAAVAVLTAVVNGWFIYQFIREFSPYYQAALEQARAGNAFGGEQPQPTARLEYLLWTILIITTLLWLLYEAPAIAGRGQTLGKRLMHIKVMAVDSTEPLGFGRAFRRWARLGLWTPFWGCAGLGLLLQFIDCLSPVFDQQLRQALHDKSARTVVVDFPPGATPHQTAPATPTNEDAR